MNWTQLLDLYQLHQRSLEALGDTVSLSPLIPDGVCIQMCSSEDTLLCIIPQLMSMLQWRPILGTLKLALGLNQVGLQDLGAWAVITMFVRGGRGLSPSGELVMRDLATLLTQCFTESVWAVCSLFKNRMWYTSFGLMTVEPRRTMIWDTSVSWKRESIFTKRSWVSLSNCVIRFLNRVCLLSFDWT